MKLQFRPWMAFAAVTLVLGLLLRIPIVSFMLLFAMGPFIWMASVHVTLILLAIDCVGRKTPRILLVAPIAYYGAGVLLAISNFSQLQTLTQELDATNASAHIIFDGTRQSLVFNPGSDTRNFQNAYDIDAVYVNENLPPARQIGDTRPLQPRDPAYIVPGGYRASRAMPESVCRDRSTTLRHSHGAHLGGYNGLCTLETPEAPTQPQGNVVIRRWSEHRPSGDVEFAKADISTANAHTSVIAARTITYPPVLFLSKSLRAR